MALESCPSCGNATSENAKACPSCGEPFQAGWAQQKKIAVEKKRDKKKLLFAVFIGSIVFMALLPSEEEKLAKLKTENPAKYEVVMEKRKIANALEVSKLQKESDNVPEYDLNKKIEIYKRLANLKPESSQFRSKLVDYQTKKRAIEAEIALKEKRAEELMEAANRRKGFHCLSAWDGSHRGVKQYVENNMRDPDSFEHIETSITPVDQAGKHTLLMKYRARNGFGGMNVAIAVATIRSSDCAVTITSLQ